MHSGTSGFREYVLDRHLDALLNIELPKIPEIPAFRQYQPPHFTVPSARYGNETPNVPTPGDPTCRTGLQFSAASSVGKRFFTDKWLENMVLSVGKRFLTDKRVHIKGLSVEMGIFTDK